jgi:hypothetical protein
MQNKKLQQVLYLICINGFLIFISGCAQLVQKPLMTFSDNLTNAVLDQNDPELVREGAPAFLLLIEGLIRQSPDSVPMRSSASQMYSLYTAAFINDPERNKKLSETAFSHAEKAFCISRKLSNCNLNKMDFDLFANNINSTSVRDIDTLSALSTSWLVWIRSNSDDWSAIAQLPKAELVLMQIVEMQQDYGNGSAKMYLGILNSLRPPALGGKPEVAKQYFEEAIAISNGNNLSAKVEYAKSYARTLYLRELHDQLLNEVLESKTRAEGFTMINTMAKEEAKNLLASADDYF